MTLPSSEEIWDHLLNSMDGRSTCFWPKLLRQLCQKWNEPEPQGLVGVVAEFQTAAAEDVDAFASHFVCRDDVKEAIISNPDIAEEMIRNCLERYGATIWNSDNTTY
jgi:hypothetical protein